MITVTEAQESDRNRGKNANLLIASCEWEGVPHNRWTCFGIVHTVSKASPGGIWAVDGWSRHFVNSCLPESLNLDGIVPSKGCCWGSAPDNCEGPPSGVAKGQHMPKRLRRVNGVYFSLLGQLVL